MKSKPKGKTPSLIGFANGRPSRVAVQRKSQCYRCGCAIVSGADCFDIPRKSGGFTRECRHCRDCYQAVLEQTSKDLAELRTL
jgi:hypothetical protein